jgi:nitroreductase
VAAAKIDRQHKIPEIEQILAVAASAQNMFLSAHALGYGVMWKTGDVAYDPIAKTTIGLSADESDNCISLHRHWPREGTYQAIGCRGFRDEVVADGKPICHLDHREIALARVVTA